MLPLHLILLPMLALPIADGVGEAAPDAGLSVPTAGCQEGDTCVPPEDMKDFVQLLREAQCRATVAPVVDADPLVIVVDRDGRVYGSGTGTRPYTIRIKWCTHELEAAATVRLQVAQRVEPEWGFRLRLKATVGILAADAFTVNKLYEALDGGLMVEPFFIQWFNLNAVIGVRSFGAGVGVELTSNMGAYCGYAMTWGSWRSNPFLAVFFSF